MNEITDYMILRGSTYGDMGDNLGEKVQKCIRQGWQPLGPAMPTNSEYAIQTMVMYRGH